MNDTNLKAMDRTENLKKIRAAGFIPGVLYGPGTMSTSVEFESKELNKIVTKHGKNAKIWITLGAEKKFGFIKDVQRHPVEGNIVHVVLQMVSADQDVKMQLPISYHGAAQLEHKLLHVQVYKSEIQVMGKPDQMPDVIVVDVSEKTQGENITAADFVLAPDIKILDDGNEIYAVIKAKQEVGADLSAAKAAV